MEATSDTNCNISSSRIRHFVTLIARSATTCRQREGGRRRARARTVDVVQVGLAVAQHAVAHAAVVARLLAQRRVEADDLVRGQEVGG